MIESYYFICNGIKYWEWRHAYRKLLEDIANLREAKERLHYDSECHYDSDQDFVKCLKDCLHACQSWLEEMRNPIKVELKEDSKIISNIIETNNI